MEQLSDSVIVWMARLSDSEASLSSLDRLLSAFERDRAARFHFPEDRARFTLGRALARTCLGQLLSQTPESIELILTDRGRPVLPDDELAFNLSHAGDFVALAVAENARVGIDLESMQRNVRLIDVAERILSATDLERFKALPEPERLPAFFRVWTRKEAYLKARGEGISEGLQAISVSFAMEEVSTIMDTRDEVEAQTWRLYALPVPEGHQGCVACDDAARKIDLRWVRFEDGVCVFR